MINLEAKGYNTKIQFSCLRLYSLKKSEIYNYSYNYSLRCVGCLEYRNFLRKMRMFVCICYYLHTMCLLHYEPLYDFLSVSIISFFSAILHFSICVVFFMKFLSTLTSKCITTRILFLSKIRI